jgi:hypothetical protein
MDNTSGLVLVAYPSAAFVGIVLLFAQLKMFSINSNLAKILKLLEQKETKTEK